MSKKSHPGDGTKGHGEKGGEITNVAHQGGVFRGILSALRQLRAISK